MRAGAFTSSREPHSSRLNQGTSRGRAADSSKMAAWQMTKDALKKVCLSNNGCVLSSPPSRERQRIEKEFSRMVVPIVAKYSQKRDARDIHEPIDTRTQALPPPPLRTLSSTPLLSRTPSQVRARPRVERRVAPPLQRHRGGMGWSTHVMREPGRR